MKIIKYITIGILLLSLSGCRTVALRSVINPLYEAKTNELAAIKPVPSKEEIEQALEGIPKWLDKEKMDLSGVGENEADFKAQKIEQKSGIKIPEFPKLEFEN